MKRWLLVVSIVCAMLVGCGDKEAQKVTDRFLGAIQKEDWAGAHAELHTDAKKEVATPDALKALVEKRGKQITEWSRNCSSGGGDRERGGYNFSSKLPNGVDSGNTVTIGVEPGELGKCNGPLFLELHKEAGTWKVRTFRY